LERIFPFAVVAVIAEGSVFLPPGPKSITDLVISLVLLAAVVVSMRLPWDRLPEWTGVCVPLAYTGSVLALILSTGETSSGVGIVILIPLVWTALFHRRWESMLIVEAVVVVEIVTSVVPIELAGAILARRILFWAVLGAVISITIQGLRARAARAQSETLRAQEQLREMSLLEDRGRIARQMQQSTMQRMIAIAFELQGIAHLSGESGVAERVQGVVNEVDETVRELRSAITGFELEASPGD
jgi:signal transduction histidine kinase